MNAEPIRSSFETLLREVEETERLIKALCNEFRRKCPVYWITLYWQERREGRPIQGPYWALLHQRRSHGIKITFKTYLGPRMTSQMIWRLGLRKLKTLIKGYSRRACDLGRRRKRLVASLDKIRRIVSPYSN